MVTHTSWPLTIAACFVAGMLFGAIVKHWMETRK